MTSKLHDYQKDLLKTYMTFDIESAGGLAAGEMFIISSGRQAGKSTLNQIYGMLKEQPPFQIEDRAQVDGNTWYNIRCNKEVAEWVRTHSEKGWWYEHIDNDWFVNVNRFDVHEKLFTLVQLKWS